MRAQILQHVPFEGPGSIASWLQAAGAEVATTRFYECPKPPSVEDFDLLVVMGGPMSVNDEAELPWLVAEKRLVRQAVEQDKAVVGICLGAQLIASAMGARVCPNGEQEIGWWPVTAEAVDTPPPRFAFPPEALAFHWHGETFDLPAGATRLARSAACANQAFQLGRRVIGLQFHLETTPASARELVSHCRAELVPARHVQTEAQILGAPTAAYTAINALMSAVLEFVA